MITPTEAARAFIEAKRLFDEAEKAKARAESVLKEAFGRQGITSTFVDGTKVSVVDGARSSYDATSLAAAVSADMFDLLTMRVVDAKKLKAAAELGQVGSEVMDRVVSYTPYQSVRVTQVA